MELCSVVANNHTERIKRPEVELCSVVFTANNHTEPRRDQEAGGGAVLCSVYTTQSPGEIKRQEVELCSVSAWIVSLPSCSSTADPSDFVFVTVLHSCCKRKLRSTQVAWHWRGPHLLNIVVLAVADGPFGLYGSERRVPATQGYTTPPPPPPPPPVSSP